MTMEQITGLSKSFKGRIIFNSMNKPYFCVKLIQNQKPETLMQAALQILDENMKKEEKNDDLSE